MMRNGVDFAFQSFPTIIHSSILLSAVAFAGCNSFFLLVPLLANLFCCLVHVCQRLSSWAERGFGPTPCLALQRPCLNPVQ